jgi:hypothetical protein
MVDAGAGAGTVCSSRGSVPRGPGASIRTALRVRAIMGPAPTTATRFINLPATTPVGFPATRLDAPSPGRHAAATVRYYRPFCADHTMNGLPTSPPRAARAAAHVLAAVLPAGTAPRFPLYRSGWLTPYTAQTIVEDALRAGRGTELDLTVPLASDDSVLDDVRKQFGWLSARGIHVLVHRALPE